MGTLRSIGNFGDVPSDHGLLGVKMQVMRVYVGSHWFNSSLSSWTLVKLYERFVTYFPAAEVGQAETGTDHQFMEKPKGGEII